MEVTKESTLKLIEELNSKEIDLGKTLEKAYEFKGKILSLFLQNILDLNIIPIFHKRKNINLISCLKNFIK